MKVEVQLFATLAAFLPATSRDGAAIIDVPDGSTVHDLLRRLGVPPDFDRVALINGHEAEPDSPLHPDDVLTVFPPLAGGL